MILQLHWGGNLLRLFFETSITTSVSPALSRARCKKCIVDEMFDGHDLWHVFSAFSVFSTNILILILDDDVIAVPLGNIPHF